MFLGREKLDSLRRLLDETAMEAKARETLKSLSVRRSLRAPAVAGLSGGQRQSVAVAKAVMWN